MFELSIRMNYQGKLIDCLIDLCLTPRLAIFQLYRGVNKLIINFDIYQT